MQTDSFGDNLHEVSNPIFKGGGGGRGKEEIYLNLSSAELGESAKSYAMSCVGLEKVTKYWVSALLSE